MNIKNISIFIALLLICLILTIPCYANMYIIKNIDGKVICLTNINKLSQQQIESGCTVSLLIKGSTQTQPETTPVPEPIESQSNLELEPKTNSIPTSSDEKKDSIIKVVDWTNYISDTGNYVYVEGILQNIGKVNATNLKVSIQALDKNKKLVSITNGYAEPSTLTPNGKAIFNIMVSYKSEIKYFMLSVGYASP